LTTVRRDHTTVSIGHIAIVWRL